ncbi:hypothetical protein SCLCIDRAFT_1218399 [Scleroderma citrinum Foug A]|uniref:Uncharacterized protein n=1 Tax=Scleroderma citrinum Foug A TaxID=1036808 RepID=A0A0C3DDD3_9AGAM|nr:hypothetical protein SCLCIDRAFT_1218399 [Scleroderma citrinum Foug A]
MISRNAHSVFWTQDGSLRIISASLVVFPLAVATAEDKSKKEHSSVNQPPCPLTGHT